MMDTTRFFGSRRGQRYVLNNENGVYSVFRIVPCKEYMRYYLTTDDDFEHRERPDPWLRLLKTRDEKTAEEFLIQIIGTDYFTSCVYASQLEEHEGASSLSFAVSTK